MWYVVLLYPPVGKPRVVELEQPVPGLKKFKSREKADNALEKFLTESPEYRNWVDGSIQHGSR